MGWLLHSLVVWWLIDRANGLISCLHAFVSCLFGFRFVSARSVSFRLVPFPLVPVRLEFRFVSFRIRVPFCFGSFRFVSICSVSFPLVPFRLVPFSFDWFHFH